MHSLDLQGQVEQRTAESGATESPVTLSCTMMTVCSLGTTRVVGSNLMDALLVSSTYITNVRAIDQSFLGDGAKPTEIRGGRGNNWVDIKFDKVRMGAINYNIIIYGFNNL